MADERSAATMLQEIEFAPDSPLEGDGFEPSVPVAKKPVSVAEGELRGIEGGSPQTVVFFRGTDGSNPSPSSGESAANFDRARRDPR
jgi:hypothetical protein